MIMIKKGVMLLLIFLVLTNGNSKIAAENSEIITKVVNASSGKILTTGIKADFEISSKEENKYKAMLKEISKSFNVTGNLEKENYCSTDFNNGEVSGYIQCIKEKDENNFSICLEKESDRNNLQELEKMITDIIDKNKEALKIQKYIKCRLKDDNLIKINNQLIDKLKAEGFSSIQTIKLYNGYSTVAFVQKGDNKESINFVVCNYNSGSFIIVGKPKIFTEF